MEDEETPELPQLPADSISTFERQLQFTPDESTVPYLPAILMDEP